MNRSDSSTVPAQAAVTTDSGDGPCPGTCGDYGEFLSRACALVVSILREKWMGRRVVRMQDRRPAHQETCRGMIQR